MVKNMIGEIEDEGEMDVFKLLRFLSNETRRSILELLAEEDRYPFQISRILDISPRLIKKYLEDLKKLGIVHLIEETNINPKGPQRTFASLNQAFSVIIDVGQNTFDIRYHPIDKKIIKEKKLKEDKTEEEIIKQRIKIIKELKTKSTRIRDFIKKKVEMLRILDEERKVHVEEINEAFYKFNKIIGQIVQDIRDREIIRSVLKMSITKSDNRISLSELSKIFEVRRERLRDRIENIVEQIECINISKDRTGEIWYSI
jgi:predicted transcriptional regulator